MTDHATLRKAKKHLRRLAHPLQPLVMLGNAGLTDGVVGELDRALDDHELVKVSARSRRADRARRRPRGARPPHPSVDGAAHRTHRRVLSPPQGSSEGSPSRPLAEAQAREHVEKRGHAVPGAEGEPSGGPVRVGPTP